MMLTALALLLAPLALVLGEECKCTGTNQGLPNESPHQGTKFGTFCDDWDSKYDICLDVSAPLWCVDKWCYVKKDCTVNGKVVSVPSVYKDSGLYFAYEVCGNPNRFDEKGFVYNWEDCPERVEPMDVYFAIDNSGSINAQEWFNMRFFISNLIDYGMDHPEDRVGVTSWSNRYRVDFTFADPISEIVVDVMKLVTLKGQTNTDEAIHFTLDQMEKETDLGRKKWLVFVTDGEPDPGYGPCDDGKAPDVKDRLDKLGINFSVLAIDGEINKKDFKGRLGCLVEDVDRDIVVMANFYSFYEYRDPTNGGMCVNPTVFTPPDPTNQPSVNPSPMPSPKPTDKPSKMPSREPTETPSESPTPKPTNKPTKMPSPQPSPSPTPKPTNKPSKMPSAEPTDMPTMKPTGMPSPMPTDMPSAEPTRKPTMKPSGMPTPAPTKMPSGAPTGIPTCKPTKLPTPMPSPKPTNKPTDKPTQLPTSKPTKLPTTKPTDMPSEMPTDKPTPEPSEKPTPAPTSEPTTLAPTECQRVEYTTELKPLVKKGKCGKKTDMKKCNKKGDCLWVEDRICIDKQSGGEICGNIQYESVCVDLKNCEWDGKKCMGINPNRSGSRWGDTKGPHYWQTCSDNFCGKHVWYGGPKRCKYKAEYGCGCIGLKRDECVKNDECQFVNCECEDKPVCSELSFSKCMEDDRCDVWSGGCVRKCKLGPGQKVPENVTLMLDQNDGKCKLHTVYECAKTCQKQ